MQNWDWEKNGNRLVHTCGSKHYFFRKKNKISTIRKQTGKISPWGSQTGSSLHPDNKQVTREEPLKLYPALQVTVAFSSSVLPCDKSEYPLSIWSSPQSNIDKNQWKWNSDFWRKTTLIHKTRAQIFTVLPYDFVSSDEKIGTTVL